jgi:hypothetical protein
MARCEICGNEYARALTISLDGSSHVFDCFECAIQALAPTCEHCGCRIIGHGMEAKDAFYCCAHCARQDRVGDLRDHA